MSQALSALFGAIVSLFLGIFRTGKQSVVINPPILPPSPIQPVPPPLPQPAPAPAPPSPINPYTHGVVIPSGTGPQSSWWNGMFRVTQPYGCTDYEAEGHNPFHNECAYFHEGIDIALPCGTTIVAGSFCTVGAIDPPGYGPAGQSAAILLMFPTVDVWLYHMAMYVVLAGWHLKPGQPIGLSGTRGYSTGCHIHFEVRPHGAGYRHSLDPAPMLRFPAVGVGFKP